MTKTFTLDVELACDFDLFGLVSSARDYSLAWALNRALRLRLCRQPELLLPLPGREPLVFSHYLYVTDVLTLRLFRNRALVPSALPKPFLAPDVREYDYLLAITNGGQELAGAPLVHRLQALPAVQHAVQFDPDTLKYKENLIL
ncbi:IPExxxVDY family protein [Hymenobacter nivis]|uniref:IPExxxVDY family protein n=1 Tax=Hymenobacter nivis TaxID=1850093 RepID=UPI001F0048DF|nr:IPExxxVDY family protein [Hymenobacter nivis]